MRTVGTTQLGRTAITFAAAVSFVFLIGGDETSNAGIQGSGRARIASIGRITGLELAQVKVQGIEYATDQAQIRINDVLASQSALKLGQVVLIEGTLNADGTTAKATRISFEADVQGPVTQINAEDGTFTVLGQKVRVKDTTLFDEGIQPSGLDGLQTGVSVQVSGFARADGELLASRVDSVLDTSSLRARGRVNDLDTAARTFRINALTVDYSAATPTGPLAAGATAKVLGYTVSSDGVLVASKVKASNGVGGEPGERGAVEGIITSFTSTADFSVNGQRIATDESTQVILRGGVLGLNAEVEVLGLFNSSGTLVATRVTAQPPGLRLQR